MVQRLPQFFETQGDAITICQVGTDKGCTSWPTRPHTKCDAFLLVQNVASAHSVPPNSRKLLSSFRLHLSPPVRFFDPNDGICMVRCAEITSSFSHFLPFCTSLIGLPHRYRPADILFDQYQKLTKICWSLVVSIAINVSFHIRLA